MAMGDTYTCSTRKMRAGLVDLQSRISMGGFVSGNLSYWPGAGSGAGAVAGAGAGAGAGASGTGTVATSGAGAGTVAGAGAGAGAGAEETAVESTLDAPLHAYTVDSLSTHVDAAKQT